MADSTLHVKPLPPSMPPTFPRLARACGIKVAVALPVAAGLVAALGKVLEERATIDAALLAAWEAGMWGLSLGGSFWGGVAVACVPLALLAWTLCVGFQLAERCSHRTEYALGLTGVVAALLWCLAIAAVHSTYSVFGNLTVYQQLALVALHAPLIVLVLAGLMLVLIAAEA